MHYYNRNLGDYAKKAGRLSMLQHGAYTLLLDSCYDREQFPTLEEAIEWTWASTKEEIEAVEFVLRRFFVLENGVFVQKRIEEEIADYREKAEKNRLIALEREAKKKNNQTNRDENSTSRARTVQVADENKQDREPNQEPITNNQEPITNIKSSLRSQEDQPKEKSKRATRLPNDWVPTQEFWKVAKELKPNLDDRRLQEIASTFRDYWISRGGAGATKLDWLATWRNWIRKEPDGQKQQAPVGQFLTAREKSAQRNAEIFNLEKARNF